MGNTFGKLLRITTYGESHGPGIGVVVDGFPGGFELDLEAIQKDLSRRKPGQSRITTQRKESDEFVVMSGVFEGKTTGMPIHLHIPNRNAKSQDYGHIKNSFRPSHADYTYTTKYGLRDYRGGGRSSARETANWVAAGALAKQLLKAEGVDCLAFVSAVGELSLEQDYRSLDLSLAEDNAVRCPDPEMAKQMEELIVQVRKEGDTVGGVVTGLVKGCPVGLGEPIFDKLHADLAKAMMGINAVKGFEYGSGFAGAQMRGSQHNDYYTDEKGFETATNHSGGIQGGISNGMDIYFRVAFKPVATLMQNVPTKDKSGNKTQLEGKGRHDPCVVPRAVPIVEAMAALVLADHFLQHRARA